MQAAIDPMYQAAYREVIHMRLLLDQLDELFQQTFALSPDESAKLNVHPELHTSGQSIELFLQSDDIVFSLGSVFDRQSHDHAWELVAFHGTNAVPQWVCTMRVGPTASGYARRIRGARLVAAIGNYLERQNDAQGEAIGFVRLEGSVAWLPQIAARHELQAV